MDVTIKKIKVVTHKNFSECTRMAMMWLNILKKMLRKLVRYSLKAKTSQLYDINVVNF